MLGKHGEPAAYVSRMQQSGIQVCKKNRTVQVQTILL